jgi:undecaprenyl-diphosphatase
VSSALAALLGVIQGITEFLPVSSKTHLVVIPALLGERPPSLQFIVLLHLGTLIALLLYFARDLTSLAVDLVRGGEGRRTVGLLALASVPAALIGFTFEATFEELLSHPKQVAFSLVITAIVLVGAEWVVGTISFQRGRRSRLPRPLADRVTTREAIGIGIAQAFALLPGISRSGSTMATGLALGLRRDVAARFSFLLAIPALIGANILELPEVASDGIGTPEIVGFATALVSGYAAVALLLRYLRRFNYLPFAAYCLVFAVAAGLALD